MDKPITVTIDATAIPEQLTGVGRYVYNLVGALGRRSDVSHRLITKTGDRSRWLAVDPGTTVYDVAPGRRPLRLAWEQTQLPRLLSQLDPQVHHGTHYTMPRLARLPKVVTVHDMTLVEHPEWHEKSKAIFFRNAIQAALRSARVIICDSQATSDRLLRFGTPAGVVQIAPLGVDLERFTPGEGCESADLAALRGLGVVGPYLAFMGTIEPRKRVHDLVRAFDRVGGRHSDLKLVIAGKVGWGQAGEDLESAISQSSYRERIVRLGFLAEEHAAPLLRRAAAVVYPSLEEGFGLPVLEALACGAPTITTLGSAMDEFATGAALMVSPGDVAALAEAIDSVISGDPAIAKRRELGLAVARARSWDECAAKHVAAYRLAL